MKTIGALANIVTIGLMLAACGSTANNNGPDAAPGGPDTGVDNTCLAAPSYGDVTLVNQKGRSLARPQVPNDPVYYEATGHVNADATPDQLLVGLFEDSNLFGGTVQPGTYQIQGDETNFATCGACVRILTDLDANGESADKDGYLATSGTVEITAVQPRLVGSVSNVTFQHVIINPAQNYISVPHPDGCQTSLGSASFDVELVPEVIQQFNATGAELDSPVMGRLSRVK